MVEKSVWSPVSPERLLPVLRKSRDIWFMLILICFENSAKLLLMKDGKELDDTYALSPSI